MKVLSLLHFLSQENTLTKTVIKNGGSNISIVELITLSIAILALFIAGLTAWWQFFRKPKISILYKDDEPYRKLLHPTNHPDKYHLEWYIRVKILNTRKVIAKNCFGKITEWYTNQKIDKNFDPIKLHWVSNHPTDYSSIDLSFQEYDFLDLVYTDRDKNKIKIYTNSHLRGVNFEFGLLDEHIFKINFYAENEISKFEYLKISYQKDDPEGKLRFIKVAKVDKKEIKKIKSIQKKNSLTPFKRTKSREKSNPGQKTLGFLFF